MVDFFLSATTRQPSPISIARRGITTFTAALQQDLELCGRSEYVGASAPKRDKR
jgi:hypothetical protein